MTTTTLIDRGQSVGGTRLDRITGIAGILAIGSLTAFVALNTGPDVTDRAAVQRWLTHRSGAAHLVATLTLDGLSYIPLLVFLGGLLATARRWDPSGLARSVAGISAAMFLAGAVASDIGTMSVPLGQYTIPGFSPSVDQVILLSRIWLVVLTEAQVALAVMIVTLTVAAQISRRSGSAGAPPRLLIWWGHVAGASVVLILLAPGNFTVFLVSNQLRLLWLLATAIWLVRRRTPGRRASHA